MTHPTHGQPGACGCAADELTALRAENARLVKANSALERQVAELSNVLVVVQRLRDAMGTGEILSVIEEVLAAIVGSEEYAVFELNAAGTHLEPRASCGVAEGTLKTVRLGEGRIGQVALSGHLFVGGDKEIPPLTACIPLRLGEKVVGVIAIFRLLPQKAELAETDRDIFELLASHAGIALAAGRKIAT